MSQLVYPIDSGRTAVGLQLLPYTLDATVELVHKTKDPHSFGHERVPVGILCGEILRTCIAEQAAGINHLHPIPELVEPHRGSRLVIPVHAGVHNQFSQSQESKADEYGFQFSVANGRDPYGMARSLEKLNNLAGGTQSSTLAKMFSSHPDSAKRAAKMRKKADQLTGQDTVQ